MNVIRLSSADNGRHVRTLLPSFRLESDADLLQTVANMLGQSLIYVCTNKEVDFHPVNPVPEPRPVEESRYVVTSARTAGQPEFEWRRLDGTIHVVDGGHLVRCFPTCPKMALLLR